MDILEENLQALGVQECKEISRKTERNEVIMAKTLLVKRPVKKDQMNDAFLLIFKH